eukprot:scaffold21096_cov90-Isochrysis_galbana.AAC.1
MPRQYSTLSRSSTRTNIPTDEKVKERASDESNGSMGQSRGEGGLASRRAMYSMALAWPRAMRRESRGMEAAGKPA